MKCSVSTKQRVMFYRHEIGLSLRSIATLEEISPSTVFRFDKLPYEPTMNLNAAKISLFKLATVMIQPQEQSIKTKAIVVGAINQLTGYICIGACYLSDRSGYYEAIAQCLNECWAPAGAQVDVSGLLTTQAQRDQREILEDMMVQLHLQETGDSSHTPMARMSFKALKHLKRQLPRHFASLSELRTAIEKLNLELMGTSMVSCLTAKQIQALYVKGATAADQPRYRYAFLDHKHCSVGADGYLEYEQAYYSVPMVYAGLRVVVKADLVRVCIFLEKQKIAEHPRAIYPFQYITYPHHMPTCHLARPTNPVRLQSRASAIGFYVGTMMEYWLEHAKYPEHIYRRSLALFSLAAGTGKSQINRACQKALEREEYSVKSIKKALEEVIDCS